MCVCLFEDEKSYLFLLVPNGTYDPTNNRGYTFLTVFKTQMAIQWLTKTVIRVSPTNTNAKALFLARCPNNSPHQLLVFKLPKMVGFTKQKSVCGGGVG